MSNKSDSDENVKIADGKLYILQIRELIEEYSRWLGRDLCFQGLDEELRDPAVKYTAPNGELLAAVKDGKVIGMAAYRKLDGERCEMKRLYVRPAARGLHLGDTLVKEIIARAIKANYKEMVLDTVKPLKAAISLYKKYGFEECEPYYNNPMDDVIYMKKLLY